MSDAGAPKLRWYRLTPDRLILALLVVEWLPWLSERICGPVWHKGYAVLTAVATVVLGFLMMLVWFGSSLLFHWRFQFSIRSLLVLFVVVAVPCSWLSWEMKKAGEQHAAVAAIVKSGGVADYDYGVDQAGRRISTAKEPSWLRNLLGDDFFTNVVLFQRIWHKTRGKQGG
jgi:hypothetical protein